MFLICKVKGFDYPKYWSIVFFLVVAKQENNADRIVLKHALQSQHGLVLSTPCEKDKEAVIAYMALLKPIKKKQ